MDDDDDDDVSLVEVSDDDSEVRKFLFTYVHCFFVKHMLCSSSSSCEFGSLVCLCVYASDFMFLRAYVFHLCLEFMNVFSTCMRVSVSESWSHRWLDFQLRSVDGRSMEFQLRWRCMIYCGDA